MATMKAMAGDVLVETRRPELLQDRKVRLVYFWAGLGVFVFVLAISSWAWWLFDLPPSTPVGVSKVPTFMLLNAMIQQSVGFVMQVFVVYWFVIRGWRRAGHLTFDGMFAISCLTLYWQDYLLNYTQLVSAFNSVFINWGSWYNHIPGMNIPDMRHFVEAPIWAGCWYVYGGLCVAILFNYIMRRAKARWPNIGKAGLIGLAMVMGIMLDMIVEIVYVTTGGYHYGGGPGPKFFAGHYYQFPVLEMFLWGPVWGAWASMRYFRNDRGESFAEKGIDEVRIGRRGKTWLRFLAICGAVNLPFLAYNAAWQPVALHATTWPEDILKRSYFTQGLCGAGTDRPCPGPDVPIFRGENDTPVFREKGSVTITPEGQVKGLERLPKVVPLTKCPDSPESDPLNGKC